MSILLTALGSNIPTATAAVEPLAFQTLGLPRIDSDVYMGSSANYNGPFDVRSATIANAGTNVRVNISMKAIMSTSFQNDWCIGGVQIYRGSTQLYSWMFTDSTGGTGSGWEWNYGTVQTAAGRSDTVTQANARSYSAINSTITSQHVNFGRAPGSSNTGCDSGISATATLNNVSTVPQVVLNYLMFAETSGSMSQGQVFYTRSPQISVQAGDVIYVAGACATRSTNSHINTFDDAVFIGVA